MQEKVIAYASHVLTKAERKWSTYDRELWAIVWAVRHFGHYLYKQPFIIVTHHKPLLGLRKLPTDNNRTGRRAHWALELDPFEWIVVHQDGRRHLNADADAMSRRPAERSLPVLLVIHIGMGHILPQVLPVHLAPSVLYITEPLSCNLTRPQLPRLPASQDARQSVSSIFVLPLPDDEFRKEQQQDAIVSEVCSWKAKGQKPPYWRMNKRAPAELVLWHEHHRLTFHNGVLCL